MAQSPLCGALFQRSEAAEWQCCTCNAALGSWSGMCSSCGGIGHLKGEPAPCVTQVFQRCRNKEEAKMSAADTQPVGARSFCRQRWRFLGLKSPLSVDIPGQTKVVSHHHPTTRLNGWSCLMPLPEILDNHHSKICLYTYFTFQYLCHLFSPKGIYYVKCYPS